MPICPSCGKEFSGISFGANPATECADCRKAKAQVASMAGAGAVVRRVPLPPVTVTIIGLNVLVYLAMTVSGVSWIDPNIRDAVKWGADFGPFTLNSDWWRLLTSTFVHFGLIHIALNMWCLWNLGTSLEPFMGRKVFGVMYIACGLAASLVSTAWNPWRVSAGASGAIFGVAGALVSYLALRKTTLDRALVKKNLKSLGLFIFYNLLYGVRGGVDNSAHLGGLVAGLILGAAIPPMVRALPDYRFIPPGPPDPKREADESRANRVAATLAIAAALILVVSFTALRGKRAAVARYGAAVKLIKAGQADDAAARLQESVKLDPDSILAQEMLGELLLQQGRAAEAVAPLEKAVALEPNAYDAQHNLALAYLGAGNVSYAQPPIWKSLELQKTDTWRSLYVQAAAEAGESNFSRATKDLHSVVQAKPDFAEAQQALSQIQDLKSASEPLRFAVPYDKLVMQSEYWPLYP